MCTSDVFGLEVAKKRQQKIQSETSLQVDLSSGCPNEGDRDVLSHEHIC